MAPTSCGCGRCSVDFTEDHRIGKEILAGVADQYRKLRNTFRYLLGALDGFAEDERVALEAMPELERYMLALLAQLDARLRTAVDGLRLQRLHARAGRLLQRGSVGLLLRYPQGQPLLRRRRPIPSAAPIAPCSTRCSTRWSAGRRRCWCSRPRKCGARAIPRRAACICSNGRRSPTVADDALVERWTQLARAARRR